MRSAKSMNTEAGSLLSGIARQTGGVPAVSSAPFTDPFGYFLAARTGAEGDLLLDGADDMGDKGRYSVAAFDPLFIIRVRCGLARLNVGGTLTKLEADPPLVIEFLEKTFPNGLMVYLLSYESNRFYEDRPAFAGRHAETDDLWCAFYPNARVFDSLKKEAFDVSVGGHSPKRTTGRCNIKGGYSLGPLSCGESREAYLKKIHAVKRYIDSGDVYQVNLSRRLEAPFSGDAASLYAALRAVNPAAYGAFLDGGDFRLLSMSPEMFFTLKGNVIETRPVKGTAPRGQDPLDDARNKERLLSSEKDAAENVMIVDLMRNDLSRICRPHSVQVMRMLECESLPTVHHLVSTVRGELSETDGAVLPGVLSACFPGGSITGAPKIRAMEVIAELESVPRGFYCGALIARGTGGNTAASLLIRTVTIKDGLAHYSTGGGITADSDPQMEYEETVHKATALDMAVNRKGACAARAYAG